MKRSTPLLKDKNGFVNAQIMSQLYRITFVAPSLTTINALCQGDYVKVCHNDERFWIEVLHVHKNTIVGRVDNDLVLEHPFKYNDNVVVQKACVYDVLFKH